MTRRFAAILSPPWLSWPCSAPLAAPPAGGNKRRGAPAPARQAALLDLTGQWVSVVTEDWRWRMVTPRKGDTASVPLNPAGRKVADAWDLAADRTRGDLCKAFGPPALIRQPGRHADPLGKRRYDAARIRRRHAGATAPFHSHVAGRPIAAGAVAGEVVPAAAEPRHLRARRALWLAARSRS